MPETADATTELTDLQLIAEVRAGDLTAYGTLFARHRQAAERMARQLGARSDADDLVAEGFSRVLSALQSGSGPDEFFRAYLLTSIRRLHIDRARAAARVRTTDDEAELDRAVDFVDPAEMRFEQGTAAAAFASLPERWQLVLWHLDVEGQKPADIAPLLGMSPNSVSALAYRAREGLRVAYLDAHLAPSVDETCRWTTARLAQHVRGTLSARESTKVDDHLETCARCKALVVELFEVNRDLAGLLAPAILGTAATGYLATSGSVASAGLFAQAAGILRRPLSSVGSGGPIGTAVGLVATLVVAAGAVAALAVLDSDTSGPTARAQGAPPATAPPSAPSEQEVDVTDAEPAPDLAAPTVEPIVPPVPAPLVPAPPTPAPTPTPPVPEPPDGGPPTPRPTPPSSSPTSPPVEPTTPAPTTPPAAPTRTDYGIAVASFTNEATTPQRRVTIVVTADGEAPRNNRLTVSLTVSGSDGLPVPYRGGLSPGWTCDEPEVSIEAMTCTRDQTGHAIPDLAFSMAGYTPLVTASITASGNVDEAPANDSHQASAPFWTTP